MKDIIRLKGGGIISGQMLVNNFFEQTDQINKRLSGRITTQSCAKETFEKSRKDLTAARDHYYDWIPRLLEDKEKLYSMRLDVLCGTGFENQIHGIGILWLYELVIGWKSYKNMLHKYRINADKLREFLQSQRDIDLDDDFISPDEEEMYKLFIKNPTIHYKSCWDLYNQLERVYAGRESLRCWK